MHIKRSTLIAVRALNRARSLAVGRTLEIATAALLSAPVGCSPAGSSATESTGAVKQADSLHTLDHLAAADAGGDNLTVVYHTIRHADGTWDHYEPVPTDGLPSPIQGFYPVERSLGANGTQGVHYLAIQNNRMYHSIRFPTDWTSWGDASDASNAQVPIADARLADNQGDLHVCAVGTNGRLYHTIRFSSTWGWQQLTEATVPTGAPTNIRTGGGVDCAGSSGAFQFQPGLYIVVVTRDASNPLQWARRNNDGTWKRFERVPTDGLPGIPLRISVATESFGALWAVVQVGTLPLYWAHIMPSGFWSKWEPIPGAPASTSFSFAHDGADFHLIAADSNNQAVPLHSIYHPGFGEWDPFNNIQLQAGSEGSGWVSAAGVQ